MRVIITGGRDFDDYELLREKCNNILSKQSDVEIVSGAANGADTLGEQYAEECRLEVKLFPVDFDKFGVKADMVQAMEMAMYSDCIIAFWDGKIGRTEGLIKMAQAWKLNVRIIRY